MRRDIYFLRTSEEERKERKGQRHFSVRMDSNCVPLKLYSVFGLTMASLCFCNKMARVTGWLSVTEGDKTSAPLHHLSTSPTPRVVLTESCSHSGQWQWQHEMQLTASWLVPRLWLLWWRRVLSFSHRPQLSHRRALGFGNSWNICHGPIQSGAALTYVLLPALLAVSFLLKWPPHSVTRPVVGPVTLPFNIKHRMLVMSAIGHLWGICSKTEGVQRLLRWAVNLIQTLRPHWHHPMPWLPTSQNTCMLSPFSLRIGDLWLVDSDNFKVSGFKLCFGLFLCE